MKVTIAGQRFDTEKALKIGGFKTAHLNASDLLYWEAELYQLPRSGHFFLAGRGNMMTPFARSTDYSNRAPAARIIPLTRRDALQWAKQFLEQSELQDAFALELTNGDIQ